MLGRSPPLYKHRDCCCHCDTYSSPGAPWVEGVRATHQDLILVDQQDLDEVVAVTLKNIVQNLKIYKIQ